MSLNMLWRRLIRRPFVLIIILVLAALAAYAGWNSKSSQAESRTAVVVLPPWMFESELYPNPVLNLTDRTRELASALVTAVQTNDVRAFVGASGATDYKVSNLGDNLRDPEPSAVIKFAVTGPDPQTAHAGAQRLIVKAGQVLEAMQYEAGVGETPRMAKLQVIAQPEETISLGTRQIRAAAMFGVAVFFAGILLFWGIESLLERRSRSRSRHRGNEHPPERDEGETHNSKATKSDAPMAPVGRPE